MTKNVRTIDLYIYRIMWALSYLFMSDNISKLFRVKKEKVDLFIAFFLYALNVLMIVV